MYREKALGWARVFYLFQHSAAAAGCRDCCGYTHTMRLVCSTGTDLVTSLDKLHIWNSWLEMRSESDGAGFQTLQQLLSESFYTRTSSSLSISLCPRLAFTAARSFAVNIYTWSREKPVFQHTLPVRDVGRYTVLYISTPKNKNLDIKRQLEWNS